MDRLTKMRKPIRAVYSKTYNAIIAECEKELADEEQVSLLQRKLERVAVELAEADSKILETLIDEGEEEAYNTEYFAVEDYREKLDIARKKIERLTVPTEGAEGLFHTTEGHTQRKSLKLPKIELRKFSGELKDWLGFWSQFKRIHDDPDIEKEDKFQYLIQATTDGSRARDIVCSFPPTAANYGKAIEGLQSRFGREELLIEFYVRELLALVVQNVSKTKVAPLQLYDRLESHLRSLESLGMTGDKYAAFLFPLVESSLPEDMIRVWLRTATRAADADTSRHVYSERLDQLLLFLKNEVEGEERISLAQNGFHTQERLRRITKIKSSDIEGPSTASDLYSGEVKKNQSNCVFCKKPHDSKDCYRARRMTLSEKKDSLKREGACFLCFRLGHRSHSCKTNMKCVVCFKRHHVHMCPELPGNQATAKSLDGKSEPETNMSNQSCSREVVLQTLMIKLKGENGRERRVRALIDSGSQRSYVLKETVQELGYQPKGSERVTHVLFGGGRSEEQNHSLYNLKVRSLDNKFVCEMPALDQYIICGDIPRLKKGPWEKELREQNIWISDYGEGCPNIEVLLGADVCGSLLTGQLFKLKCGLIAVETKLGWLIMGKVPGKEPRGMTAVAVTSLLIQNAVISDLWRLDTLGIKDPVETRSRHELEQAALDHFKETIMVNEEGRYEVCMPWLEGRERLQENTNFDTVIARCVSTATKLLVDGRYDDYDAVFEEWLRDNVIEVVPENELKNKACYLPHRGVFKENSTTKVRPVFDASFKTGGTISLNDCLEKGPNLIEQIPPIILRFRREKIGVVADIKRAFLQIAVTKKDRDFLRFVWWENFAERKIKVFRHCRIVFGLNCSPFLLAAVLNLHLEECPAEFMETAEILRKSFYVDNCVTSVSSEGKLLKFIQDSQQLLASACFELRGWEHTSLRAGNEQKSPIPVLGILWDKEADVLFCDLKPLKEPGKDVTRRKILSVVHRIFDPIGFSCPVTLIPKLLIQNSWDCKIGWDEILPEEMRKKFEAWISELPLLSEVRIPRCHSPEGSTDGWSLHTFCDASKAAYSTVVFLRSTKEGKVSLSLLQAKSRVAPLQNITIPRLELMACCIGARLTSSVIEGMELKHIPIYCWTDSSTALYWIKGEEPWGTFVNNRVREIRELTAEEMWRHVPGELNPADLPSRGCSAGVLLRSRWWEGPSWLKLDEDYWPKKQILFNEEEILKEKRKRVLTALLDTADGTQWYLRRFSKYSRMVRLVGWMRRFATNSLNPNDKHKGELTVLEIEQAERRLLKIVQHEVFKDEEDVRVRLKTLDTFIDEEGLIRVKTKITRRKDEENFRSPVVLPSEHELVKRLIRERHLQASHAGTQFVLNDLRQQFWILRGRKTVRGVLSKCVRCRRYSAKGIETPPPPLPEDRVRDALIFEVTGVDAAGPMYLKGGEKTWILLFTCAVYRAVHLELITSLSTPEFLLGLRRFVARRGRPKVIYSDNGTNFVGAQNLLKTLDWELIAQKMSVQRIQWKTIPPSAAWWGGWWERLVQMVKKLLKRVLGRASLKYEELVTILCDAEAVINSRPLTYLSEDPGDLSPLTPAMFIQDIQNVGVPDLDQLDEVNISKRFRYQQNLRETLRRRFRDEYLGLLVRQPKRGGSREVKVGEVMLIGSDHKRKLNWPMGVVTSLIPGIDKHVRVVKLKTAMGELTRPVQRVYPLEVSSEDPLVFCRQEEEKEKTTSRKNDSPSEVGRRVMTKSGRRVRKPAKYDL